MPRLSIDLVQPSWAQCQDATDPDCADVENILSLIHRKICAKKSRLHGSSGSLGSYRGLTGVSKTALVYTRQLGGLRRSPLVTLRTSVRSSCGVDDVAEEGLP